ncbi:pyridoxal-dependent decarboxylase [Xenorhabdus innexi]|uniref:Histidine decarboxylase n=1 Tax=Xenorhabdus innexi TaxID=290109 RepID=A0A1N6N009_9GAMM|nr:pyridoxal-dependent decarboxylase [Xenorhabdus innexi]PHM37711.1 histidine decarboxylase [Xenorhabdus innexi]SIP74453.1 Histidine decarboxylase [Xenorhabdus innexi]
MNNKIYTDLDKSLFKLSEEGLTDTERGKALSDLGSYVKKTQNKFLGYQTNQKLSYSSELSNYLDIQLNNVGDPFLSGSFKLNSKVAECAVLDYFAKLWNASDSNNTTLGEGYWGYVLSMGSTEGNLYALRNARDYLAGKILWIDLNSNNHIEQGSCLGGNDNSLTPILFYSEDTHYSIDKAKDLLALSTFAEIGESRYPGQCPIPTSNGKWPTKVPSLPTGSIDINKLSILVEFFASRGFPIVINFNYGTTFKGALDDVSGAIDLLLPILEKYGLKDRTLQITLENGTVVKSPRNGYWFHIDAALGGVYGSFMEKAREQGIDIGAGTLPSFDFRNPIHSIVTSGHKEMGTPWPTGVYMTKQKYLLNFANVDYIGAQDSTLSGSRNGFSALLLWHYLARYSYNDQIESIVHRLKMSESVYQKLRALGVELGLDLHVHRSPLSLSILFRCPNNAIVDDFSLSTEAKNGIKYAHLFVMQHVTDELINQLIAALRQPDAFNRVRSLDNQAQLTDMII